MLNQRLWFFSALPVMWNININKIQILWVLFSVMQNLKESQLYVSHSNKHIKGASLLILKISFNKTIVLTGNERILVQHTQILVFLISLGPQQWNMWAKNWSFDMQWGRIAVSRYPLIDGEQLKISLLTSYSPTRDFSF